MNMQPYTFTIKLTPRRQHYCIVSTGADIIYVTRKAYTSSEQATTEAREYLEEQQESSHANPTHQPND